MWGDGGGGWGGFRAQVSLLCPSGLSAVRQSLRFKCKRSPLTLKGKKKPKPTEPTSARGVSRRSLYNFQGCESFQRSEGTYGRDRAPRLPARAGISLCPLPLTALSLILYLACSLSRGGAEVPTQILA